MDVSQIPAAMVEAAARAVQDYDGRRFSDGSAWENLAGGERDSYRNAGRVALAAAFEAGEACDEWGVKVSLTTGKVVVLRGWAQATGSGP